jgi:uncharacterized membrane protein
MTTSSRVGDIITKVTAFGVAGWVAENAICGQDRYSALFRGAKIPFMPIYAVNGVVLTAASSYVSKWPLLGRGLVYSALGTIVEYAGCQIDRHLLSKQPSWDHGRGDALARGSDGCVSFMRSALWGGMGLIAEKVT